MLVDAVETALVVLVGVIPGALFVWGWERQRGTWGIKRTDRVLRMAGASVVLHVLAAPATYWFWLEYLQDSNLAEGGADRWAWASVILFVMVPGLLGIIVGWFANQDWWPGPWLRGKNSAPRAWDQALSGGFPAYVRLRLDTGHIHAGMMLNPKNRQHEAYAAGYGEEDKDILLYPVLPVDDKEQIVCGPEGINIYRGLWISASRIVWMELTYVDDLKSDRSNG
jgi:ABC-type Fe3+ transport system permease subunit